MNDLLLEKPGFAVPPQSVVRYSESKEKNGQGEKCESPLCTSCLKRLVWNITASGCPVYLHGLILAVTNSAQLVYLEIVLFGEIMAQERNTRLGCGGDAVVSPREFHAPSSPSKLPRLTSDSPSAVNE